MNSNNRQWYKQIKEITLIVYKETNDQAMKEAIQKWEEEEWLTINLDMVPLEFHNLTNYINAKIVKSSPLYQQMQEDEKDGTKLNSEEET